ncbi:MAG: DUF4783 domain-containing protein [Bacteroidales bacterium]|nr:DUF4783 domain-containing protein [Bacteroidales bacterium]
MIRYRQFYRLSFFLILLSTAFMRPVRSEIPEAVINAIGRGNAAVLASYFNPSLELAIVDKEDVYTKQQAELIMRDFFTRNTPSSFTILHKGGKEGSQFAIGNLVTSGGSYRVTILVKMKDGKTLIHQLLFEKDGE